ncbi:MAG: RCC1 domain-containing protein, partial [bacterium]
MRISRSAVALALFSLLSPSLLAQAPIVAWGRDQAGQVSNAPSGTGFVQVATGVSHCLALHADGSIASWGADNLGQVSNTPTGNWFVQVATGGGH